MELSVLCFPHKVIPVKILARDRQIENCIAICIRCAAACDHCSYVTELALAQDDKGRTIRLDKDCAAVCRLLASMLATRQSWHQDICHLCAQICSACAAEYQQFDEAHAQYCAKVCEQCRDACTRLVA